MSDFAKASLVSLIHHQLRRSHPELLPGTESNVDGVRNAHVSTKYKRDFLDLVWHKAGPLTLLGIGQGVEEMGYDPVWHDAVRSAGPWVLFDKWRRFERFAHSQNRLEIDHTHDKAAAFQRYRLQGGAPTRPENLLICGLIVALLEKTGCQGLLCNMPVKGGGTFRIRDRECFHIPQDANSLLSDSWSIEWQSFHNNIEVSACRTRLPDITFPQPCDATLKKCIESVLRYLMTDVSRQWKVECLAAKIGLSTRSLQRRLQLADLSFSQLVRLVRMHEACRLLKDSDIALTFVAFCTGFSDSAHFSRDFRASMGMTPSDYRGVWRNS